LVLAYPPFCTPTVPPYSITHLASFLSANSDSKVKCLDLNAKFHRRKFAALYKTLDKAKNDMVDYSQLLEKYSSKSKKAYREDATRADAERDIFEELLGLILREEPDVVGFSLVYNSQIHYCLRLAEALERGGIDCVAGGPAAGNHVAEKVRVLKDEVELLEHLTGEKKAASSHALDFSAYPSGDYLTKEMIYPVRSSYGCCYGACAFCNHHGNVPYREIDVEAIKETVLKNGMKNLFFIDDTITAKRLSELAEALGPLHVKWWCQTRPTRDLLGLFAKLRESGLAAVSFGVESGNQRILDSMRKGTKVDDIRKVLRESHDAGVRNIVFIMFGFPGEDEASFSDTMKFLRENRENIDIVSASQFGLQRGSRVHDHPGEYGVFDIRVHGAELGEIIRYKTEAGLSERQTRVLKENAAKELRGMNRLPKIFCLLKEQTLLF